MTTDKRKKDRTGAAHLRRLCRLGMLIALALVFGYLETLIPVSIGIPGVKLGLANLVTMVALYTLDAKSAWLVLLCRVVLSSMLFGNLTMLLYSLAGAVVSLTAMLCIRRIACFSVMGVCIVGGVMHNMGQLLAARLVVDNRTIWYYFPVLCIAGMLCGGLIGILAGMIIQSQITGGDKNENA